MVSGWCLVMLAVCGLVRAQVIIEGKEDALISNPEKTTEDLRVLVQQLITRVDKLEKEREDSCQSDVT